MTTAIPIKHTDPARGPRFYTAQRSCSVAPAFAAIPSELVATSIIMHSKPQPAATATGSPVLDQVTTYTTPHTTEAVVDWRKGAKPKLPVIIYNDFDYVEVDECGWIMSKEESEYLASKHAQQAKKYDYYYYDESRPLPSPSITAPGMNRAVHGTESTFQVDMATPRRVHESIVDPNDPFVFRGNGVYFEVSAGNAAQHRLHGSRSWPRVDMSAKLRQVAAKARNRSPSKSSSAHGDVHASGTSPLPTGRPLAGELIVGTPPSAKQNFSSESTTASFTFSTATEETSPTHSRRTSHTQNTSIGHGSELHDFLSANTVKTGKPSAQSAIESSYMIPTGLLDSPVMSPMIQTGLFGSTVASPAEPNDHDHIVINPLAHFQPSAQHQEASYTVHAQNASLFLGPPRSPPRESPDSVKIYFRIADRFYLIGEAVKDLLIKRREDKAAVCLRLEAYYRSCLSSATRMRIRGHSLDTMLSPFNKEPKTDTLSRACRMQEAALQEAEKIEAFVMAQWSEYLQWDGEEQFRCRCCDVRSRA